MKYRIFKYECGASGFHCEEYPLDPITFDYAEYPSFVTAVAWDNPCRYAMEAIVRANQLVGKVVLDPRSE